MSSPSILPPTRSVQEIVRSAWRREWMLIGVMAATAVCAGVLVNVVQRSAGATLPRQAIPAATPISGCPEVAMTISAAQAWLPAGIALPAMSQVIAADGDPHGTIVSLCTRLPATSIARQMEREFTLHGWQEHYANVDGDAIRLTLSNDLQVAFVVTSDLNGGLTRIDISLLG